MEKKYLQWANFKASLALKKATLQFDETDDVVTAYFVDGGIKWFCMLWKREVAAGIAPTNTADLADFDLSYRNSPRVGEAIDIRNASGMLVSAKSAYAYSEEDGTFEGTGWLRPTLGALSFHDLVVVKQLYVQGGIIIVGDVAKGDIAEFSVVDKDDVLGLFSAYGLVKANGDVLELRKYVRKHGVPFSPSGESVTFSLSMATAALVSPGLYLRLGYTSVGTVDPWVSINYEVFEGD